MTSDPEPSGDTRFARSEDAFLRFQAAGALQGRITIEEMVGHHDPLAGRWTFFRIWEGFVAGAAVVSRRPNALHVEYLTRNDAARVPPNLPVGRTLLQAVEAIARELGLRLLTLDSVDDPVTLAFYRRAGFVPSGPVRLDRAWGALHPMERPVGELL
jgi:GNAT superfamily N-acetyltransferase